MLATSFVAVFFLCGIALSRAEFENAQEQKNCSIIKIACADGIGSYVPLWECDGEWDCSDGSDEKNCVFTTKATIHPPLPVTNQFFTTETSRNFSTSVVTPGSEVCEKGQVKCRNGACIPIDKVCDGIKDCNLGEDERKNYCDSCESQFKCLRGNRCVPRVKRCDGVYDCKDKSDEARCITTENDFVKITFKDRKGYFMCADNHDDNILNSLCHQLGRGNKIDIFEPRLEVGEKTLTVRKRPTTKEDGFHIESCVTDRKLKLLCKPPECGKRSPNYESQSTQSNNGNSISRWPWVVYLKTRLNQTHYSFCTGSIVGDRHVLTSAKCLNLSDEFPVKEVAVLNTNTGNYNLLEVEIFFLGTHLDEPVLVKLKNNFKFNNMVQPICMVDHNTFEKNAVTYEVCVSAGLRKIVLNQEEADSFKLTENDMVESKMSLLPDTFCPGNIGNNRLCAGNIYPEEKNCHEDRGGPLMCRQQNGLWVQVGVSSYAPGDCSAKIFADVSFYYPYIN